MLGFVVNMLGFEWFEGGSGPSSRYVLDGNEG